MKKVLKISEIIEKLHKILNVSFVNINLMTLLEYSQFHRVYICLIHYSGHYQTVSITLHYGWIQLEFCECSVGFKDAIKVYCHQIEIVNTVSFEEYYNCKK